MTTETPATSRSKGMPPELTKHHASDAHATNALAEVAKAVAEPLAPPASRGERHAACDAAIREVLQRYNCTIVTGINQPEAVAGQGVACAKMIISATWGITPLP